jgi:hypothetical protein
MGLAASVRGLYTEQQSSDLQCDTQMHHVDRHKSDVILF